jgi:quaternary ammonium compound-resistance protein SugE
MAIGSTAWTVLLAAFFTIAQVGCAMLLGKTDGFRSVGWTAVVVFLLIASYAALATLVRNGAPLSLLSPIFAALCPLLVVAGAVLFLGESASWLRIGLLVVACALIGIAARH